MNVIVLFLYFEKKMIQTFQKLQSVQQKFISRPVDEVQSYLCISEILKVLSDEGIINESSYEHHQICLDFIMKAKNNPETTQKEIFSQLADTHNKSIRTIEGIVYARKKET